MSLTTILFLFNSVYSVDLKANGKPESLYYVSHCNIFISLCEML